MNDAAPEAALPVSIGNRKVPEGTVAANSAYRVILKLADVINRDMPITLALVFARIAAAGPAGIFQQTVQRELNLTPASMTRALSTLSDIHYSKTKPGLGLIVRSIDFHRDGRNHIIRLTDKGRATIAAITFPMKQ